MKDTAALPELWKDLSARQKGILALLCGNAYGMCVESLALGLCVSTKTVRSDLAGLEERLRATSVAVERRSGGGVVLRVGDEQERAFLHHECAKLTILSLDARKVLIARKLLLPPAGGLTETGLEETLFVSRSSIRNELKLLEKWFSRFGLTIRKQKNRGIYLEGGEWSRRRALIVLFQNACVLREEQAGGGRVGALHHQLLQEFYPGFDGGRVERLLTALEASCGIVLQEEVYLTLWFSLCTGIYRLRRGCPVDIPQERFPELYGGETEKALETALPGLSDRERRALPPSEKAFIRMHLDAAGLWGPVPGPQPADLRFRAFRDDIIHHIETILNIRFWDDLALIQDFSQHLRRTVLRTRYGIYVANPLLQEIKKNYPGIWATTWASSVLFEKHYGLQITEDEIGFLAMYVGIAAKRSKSAVKACIVCEYGVGVSGLLREILQSAIPRIDITDVLSYAQYRRLRREKGGGWQIVFSTRAIEEESLPVITVSSIPSEKDLERIRRSVQQTGRAGRRQDAAGREGERLFCPALVRIDHPAWDKRKLLEVSCGQLQQQAYVLDGFLPSLLEREEKISTEIGSGIAIPHGNPAFVRRSGILTLRLREPILWGPRQRVDLIFLLALRMESEQPQTAGARRFFKMLAALLEDRQAQSRLRSASSPEEFTAILEAIQ